MINRNKKGQFIKGYTPWIKGRKAPWAKNNPQVYKKGCIRLKGKAHPSWKGDAVSYRGLHKWLQRELGKADKCENPNCDGKCKMYDWALLKDRKYERKIENFWQLCRFCHIKYDKK